jgi:hypothetical protein
LLPIERSFDDRQRSFGYQESLEFCARDPFHAASVVSGENGSSHYCTQVIVKDVMVFGTATGIGDDAFKYFEEPLGADDESGFFKDLAFEGVFDSFTSFNEAAGERPISLQGTAGALDEEDRVAAEDERADAGEGVTRVAAGHG